MKLSFAPLEGITDDKDDLVRLGEFIGSLSNVKALDVLPYHTMGVNKYKELGIPYLLEGVQPMDRRHTQKWQNALNRALILENDKKK